MPPITFSGLASGIDTKAIVDAILGVERQPLERLQDRRQLFSQQKAALDELRGRLTAFESSLRDLKSDNTFRGRAASVSDDGVLRVTAGPGAELGRFDVEVTNLAAAHKVKSDGFATSDGGLVANGTISIQSGSNDPIVIDVDANTGNNSLQAIRDEINNADAGVQASVLFDGSEYRLTVRAKETGTANALTISDGTDLDLDVGGNEISAAEDAQVQIDGANGISYTSSSNKVTGVIPGVTLNLLQETAGSPVTVDIAQDDDGVIEAVGDLVTKYNELIDFFSAQFDTKAGGPLASDPTARNIQFSLQRQFTGGVAGIPFGQVRSLSSLGVSFDGKTGKAALDRNELRDVLETRYDEVGNLFLSAGRTTDQRVQFIGATAATVPGEYAVEITSAAEQATVAGSTAITSLNKDEDLTITVGTDTIVVNLLKNQVISEIVDQINADLVAAGLEATASDDGGKLRIASDEYSSSAFVEVTSDRVDASNGKSTGFGTTPVSDNGADLAGKIGGVDATADGQFLIAADGGDYEGLKVKVTATAAAVAASGGDFGTVSFSRGLVDSLISKVDQFTKFGSGQIELSRESLDTRIESLNRDIERVEDRLVARETQLIRAFSRAEQAISALNSQQGSLGSFTVI